MEYDKWREFSNNNNKTPEEAAKLVGKLKIDDHLVHNIREIEFAILKLKNKNYHIITYTTACKLKPSKIFFRNNNCMIRIPPLDGLGDKKVRLILAHELGHLIYNFKYLDDHKELNNRIISNEEEQFAWEFAFYLINMKSIEHENNNWQERYTYSESELKEMYYFR